MLISAWNGPLLQTALQEQPSLTLEFYSYGVLLRKREGEAVSEYPVDPQQIAIALSAKVSFDSGLLSSDTLLMRQDGLQKLVVEYRAAQKTGLYLDGTETPLRVPLPGLLLIRRTTEGRNPSYRVYAVKKRPTSLEVPLFCAPLPNVHENGSICWGTVQQPSETVLAGHVLTEDWKVLLGSAFGDHGVGGKSYTHLQDIRQLLIELEQRKARVYPKRDLIPAKMTLAEVLQGVWT